MMMLKLMLQILNIINLKILSMLKTRKINNKKENYLIYSDEITYFKNEELIFSKGNSKAIDDDVEIDVQILNIINLVTLSMLKTT